MNLYLVQHALAMPETEDIQRPLSKRGLNETIRIAGFLSVQANLRVSRILHSDKLRAQQTAEILAEGIEPEGGVSATDGLKPMDDPAVWIDRLTAEQTDIMLVGHLPHLSRLVSRLVCEDETRTVVTFRNSGVVALGLDDNNAWSVSWVITPKLLLQ
ncbi:MAG: phosphohistidine phosphatase SixA [candidate division Zixibacteria bacterium]|nr:phosphohistidine phosphatase SixA [candidate division Zixibacteria bacterium]